jgi:hypothetical protein
LNPDYTKKDFMPPKKQKPRRAPDYAIQQRKKIDAEVRMRLEHQKDTFKANSVAKWAEDQFRKANLKGITPEQQKMREDEIRMANKELVLVRRNKMRNLYENDLQSWSAALEKQGLAIIT